MATQRFFAAAALLPSAGGLGFEEEDDYRQGAEARRDSCFAALIDLVAFGEGLLH